MYNTMYVKLLKVTQHSFLLIMYLFTTGRKESEALTKAVLTLSKTSLGGKRAVMISVNEVGKAVQHFKNKKRARA